MSSELAIIKQENIQTIVSAAPQSYNDNKLSCERCISAGQSILNTITANGGMTDEIDKEAALFIEKARKTVRKMNEKRSPVTKLFDDIRREFTVIENAIDPTKVDTIPINSNNTVTNMQQRNVPKKKNAVRKSTNVNKRNKPV
ncbi:hypothetical protein SFC43_04775 [Bacteroides sp. CR5/BHMF/2]|nr:hypothetical protein [Bacteroides sp. CR5/BHMF/2]